jgi:hypothetical protein
MSWIIAGIIYLGIGLWTSYKVYMMEWKRRANRDRKRLDGTERLIGKAAIILWPAFLIAMSIVVFVDNGKIIPLTPRWFATRRMAKLEMLERGRKALIGETEPEPEEIVDWAQAYKIFNTPLTPVYPNNQTSPYTHTFITNNTNPQQPGPLGY